MTFSRYNGALANSTKYFSSLKHDSFAFFDVKLGYFTVRSFFYVLETLTLNDKGQIMKKTKFGMIFSIWLLKVNYET